MDRWLPLDPSWLWHAERHVIGVSRYDAIDLMNYYKVPLMKYVFTPMKKYQFASEFMSNGLTTIRRNL